MLPSCTFMGARTPTGRHRCTHARAHACVSTHTHARARAHSRAHAHTSTQPRRYSENEILPSPSTSSHLMTSWPAQRGAHVSELSRRVCRCRKGELCACVLACVCVRACVRVCACGSGERTQTDDLVHVARPGLLALIAALRSSSEVSTFARTYNALTTAARAAAARSGITCTRLRTQ